VSHGVMLVGPAGSGKTAVRRTLLSAMDAMDGTTSVTRVFDPKAVRKDELFGVLDATTREWTDGLFTAALRAIIDRAADEDTTPVRHWLIFDGDVDPVWVESMNSLLDDNRVLTLPNGERLALPPTVRILFEVEDLAHATPATVSRCGMLWFSPLPLSLVAHSQLLALRADHVRAGEVPRGPGEARVRTALRRRLEHALRPLLVRSTDLDAADPKPDDDGPPDMAGPVLALVEDVAAYDHIMDHSPVRVLLATVALLADAMDTVVAAAVEATAGATLDSDEQVLSVLATVMTDEATTSWARRVAAISILWAAGGSINLAARTSFGSTVRQRLLEGHDDADLPTSLRATPLVDIALSADPTSLLAGGTWVSWQSQVPAVEIESGRVGASDLVIPTVDVARHEAVVSAWLRRDRPVILCGSPGTGKSMTLTAVLRAAANVELVTLNFSSATSCALLVDTLRRHTDETRDAQGQPVLRPRTPGAKIVLFCDEINLPAQDDYGTVPVIALLRSLVERGGFWRPRDGRWVRVEQVQVVGACNPPADPGRVPLARRFLRHAPLLQVDFPSALALRQIYGTMTRAALKRAPALRSHATALAESMCLVYEASQRHFTPDQHPHYVYSPRELTRWIRALYEVLAADAAKSAAARGPSLAALVRLWAHEGLRLFSDRLVTEDERLWTDQLIDRVADEQFGPALAAEGGVAAVLARPLLFSDWLTRSYEPVARVPLRAHVQARLRVFYEEELDVPVVLFDDVLAHILRLDRVFRQPRGHALLIGESGSGKTLLSRFVAWLGGLRIFTIKVNARYTAEDFDTDLRRVMCLAGVDGDGVCFIFDESNVLESSFLEKMNTLLAGGEVPGLFDGESLAQLLSGLREAVRREAAVPRRGTAGASVEPVSADDDEALFAWFTARVQRNLHVVFTMNPANPDFHNRTQTSPALFNRCVIDWFGDWSDEALHQVAHEFTQDLELDSGTYQPPPGGLPPPAVPLQPARAVGRRDAVVSALVHTHRSVARASAAVATATGRRNYITPRHFLDVIAHFGSLLAEKQSAAESAHSHVTRGLRTLASTSERVQELQAELAEARLALDRKVAAAETKLSAMVDEQSVAEERRRASVELSQQLALRDDEISKRSSVVQADLDKAEPALKAAQAAVSEVRKRDLDELRALPNPPPMIRMTLEAVCIMLSGRPVRPDWTAIRRQTAATDFISSVVNFDPKSVTADVRAVLGREYLSKAQFSEAAATRASKACGPLRAWLGAQADYATILAKCQPLRDEVSRLEEESSDLRARQAAVAQEVTTLEASIASLKAEYAALVADAERFRLAATEVEAKVGRSCALVEQLEGEGARWEEQSESFRRQTESLVGDALVGAAFLAYGGFFDQRWRADLTRAWTDWLRLAQVKLSDSLSLVDYLSTPEERLRWQTNELPRDVLCEENAALLTRFNRFPLVIDPSGQAASFLLAEKADQRIVRTSFLADSFMRDLETALRFGTSLLVDDVESIDPVVNPVLNREVHKKGGRMLVKLGDQEVDFSPTFAIFLSCRDPNALFTPDLSSRVTFVNFSVTPDGLREQALGKMMTSLQPAVEAERASLVRLTGDCSVRLRELERQLLDAIAETSGSLLDDDTLLSTLEATKVDAAEVTARLAEAAESRRRVDAVSDRYRQLAGAASDVFFALKEFRALCPLYEFGLPQYLAQLDALLAEVTTTGGEEDDEEQARARVSDLLYRRTAGYYAPSLFALHRPILHLRLGLIQSPDTLSLATVADTPVTAAPDLLAALPTHTTREPDDHELLLAADPSQPVLIVSKPGVDVSARLVALAAAQDVPLARLAMGSPGGFAAADAAIFGPARKGWVLLLNVHLAPRWLAALERRLAAQQVALAAAASDAQRQQQQQPVRLFLATEAPRSPSAPLPAVPRAMVRAARVVVLEPAPGLGPALERLWPLATSSPAPSPAVARARFLVTWHHAASSERPRFGPLGTAGAAADVAESDLRAALDAVNRWSARDTSHAVPWHALAWLLTEALYGGRADNPADKQTLSASLHRLLSPAAVSPNFRLTPTPTATVPTLPAPAATGDAELAALSSYVATLAAQDTTSPALLGLPAAAAGRVQAQDWATVVRGLGRVIAGQTAAEEAAPLAERTASLQAVVAPVLATLAEVNHDQVHRLTSPLGRALARELRHLSTVLAAAQRDLADLAVAAAGTTRLTQHLRTLASSLATDTVPDTWRHSTHRSTAANGIRGHFALLGEAALSLQAAARALADGETPSLWWGGAAFPAAWLTATRQAAARAHTTWSLETLELHMSPSPLPTEVATVARVDRLVVEGAQLADGTPAGAPVLTLAPVTDHLASTLPPLNLGWAPRSDANDSADRAVHAVPLYAASDRSHLIANVPVRLHGELSLAEGGVALLLSSDQLQ